MFHRNFLLLLPVLFIATVSCSNYFTRKGCEKVNWFQHANDVAMRGQRLEEDERLKQCERAETDINSAELDRGFKLGMENYCKPDTAHAKGVAGDGFNYDFCDSNMTNKLRARHTEGIRKFCQPDFGYSFASKGGVYREQCPKDMEAAYLPKYRKGRQVFLRNKIASNEAAISGIDGEIRSDQNKATQITYLMASLPKTSVMSKTKKYDEITKTYKEETAVTEDPEVRRRREDLEYQLRQVNGEISEKQSQQRQLRDEVHTLRSELEGLN